MGIQKLLQRRRRRLQQRRSQEERKDEGGHQDQELPRRRKTRAQSTMSMTFPTHHLSPRKAPTIPEIQTTDQTLPTPVSRRERRLRTQAGRLTTTIGDQGK